ncbi:MAG TPA: hypothetical protein VFW39_03730 [Sphingomicrobium sp.]|nr:hypothetical protein [Sphingomicrobium sp.]
MNALVLKSNARRTTMLWAAAFVVSMGLASGLVGSGRLDTIETFVAVAIPMLLLVPMVRSAERMQAAAGCATAAMRTYNRRTLVMSFGYVLALFLTIGVTERFSITGPLLWVLALLPAIPIIGIVWAMARLLIDETDEYQRLRMVRASLVATGLVLVSSTLWGFLEMFGLAPHLWLWAVFPVWAIGLAIGQLVNRFVFGQPGGC